MTIAIARKHVLRGVLARTLEASTLARIFFATEFTRHEGRDQDISASVDGGSQQRLAWLNRTFR
jgi:hypothetical protein